MQIDNSGWLYFIWLCAVFFNVLSFVPLIVFISRPDSSFDELGRLWRVVTTYPQHFVHSPKDFLDSTPTLTICAFDDNLERGWSVPWCDRNFHWVWSRMCLQMTHFWCVGHEYETTSSLDSLLMAFPGRCISNYFRIHNNQLLRGSMSPGSIKRPALKQPS